MVAIAVLPDFASSYSFKAFIFKNHLYWVFGSAILVEAMLILYHQRFYAWRESLTSLGVAVGHGVTGFLFKAIPLGFSLLLWEYRLWTIPLDQVWGLGLLFFGLEFCYYWHHRISHRVRWFWLTHAVHHSAKHLNLSAAYRLGWTGVLSGHFLFYLPLVGLGFHPLAVMVGLSLNLLYQFWIHTELIPKLGPLEWVLNTPSHHRVHHGSNVEYLDCNYGGVLIVFDRLFGTWVEEDLSNPPVYGLVDSGAHPEPNSEPNSGANSEATSEATSEVNSGARSSLARGSRSQLGFWMLSLYNPVAIALGPWLVFWQDLRRAASWTQRWQYALYPPDWRPGDRD